MNNTPIRIFLPKGGFSRSAAVGVVRQSGLVGHFEQFAPGAFGLSARAAGILEALVEAVDLGFAAAAHLEGAILESLSQPGSFQVAELKVPHRRLLAAFQLVVTADDALRRLQAHCPAPQVEGTLELDGFDELMSTPKPHELAARVLRLARRYLELKSPRFNPQGGDADVLAGTTLAAFCSLLRGALLIFARTGELHPMVQALSARKITVAGYPYEGLHVREATEAPSGLLPLRPQHIVGNEDYLQAGMRLARDVAGFDFERGRNPKKVNPILFGLGRPGCGKTVTAHAVGNYFLDFCREREIRARFVVVRRSDWASSYQNASAANLIRLFREEVYGFDGVCGVYWPDIDTALASRSNAGLRSEEKQNLGAVFGIFDGTLLPKDGKWFMICDANTMHMDEAAISRIAQNPFTVEGPTTPEHYIAMMRDLILKDLRDFVPADEASWQTVGKLAAKHELSGRNVDNICGNVRAHIQDFEYPEAYFRASSSEREKIIRELSRAVDTAFLLDAVESWAEFQKEAQAREEEERFQDEVKAVVRQLNASRTAMEMAAAAVGSGEGA